MFQRKIEKGSLIKKSLLLSKGGNRPGHEVSAALGHILQNFYFRNSFSIIVS
jgi:hypothetical protein